MPRLSDDISILVIHHTNIDFQPSSILTKLCKQLPAWNGPTHHLSVVQDSKVISSWQCIINLEVGGPEAQLSAFFNLSETTMALTFSHYVGQVSTERPFPVLDC